MESPTTGNDAGEPRAGIPAKITTQEVAWWLSTGEADPSLANRFLYGTPEDARRRQHIAAQVGRLIDAAQAAGVGDTLMGILAKLLRQPPVGQLAENPTEESQ